TSFSYMSSEFHAYNFTQALTVTFNVVDTKAFVEFALHQNQMVNVYLQPDSRPIEFVFQSSADNFSARLILATFDFAASEQPIPPPFNATRAANLNRSIDRSQNTNNTSINESLNYT